MMAGMDRVLAALLLVAVATDGMVWEHKPPPVAPALPNKPVPVSQPRPWETKVTKEPTIPPTEDLPLPDRRLGPVICPIAGACWQAGKPVRGA